MKKHLSVLYLAVRSTLLPVLVVLALMAALETAAFALVLRLDAPMPLSEVWEKSRIPFLAAGALVAVCLLHLQIGTGATQGYTLRRLRVKERTVTLWWWLSALINLTLLWAAQTVVALALSHWYAASADPAFVNPQTVFLAFYQIDFLHGLLPLGDGALWVRNGFVLAALALCVARAPHLLRTGRKPVAAIALLSLTAITFPARLGNFDIAAVLSVTGFLILIWSLYQLFGGEEVQT